MKIIVLCLLLSGCAVRCDGDRSDATSGCARSCAGSGFSYNDCAGCVCQKAVVK